jgi:acetyltransferase-like isoleucine patch superfamily enzyme
MRVLYKVIKLGFRKIDIFYSWMATWLKFKLNGISFCPDFVAKGRPVVNINLKGHCVIGKKLVLNSGKYYNMIGRQQQCYFIVGPNAKLVIGNNVGISSSAIVCHSSIIIGDNVKIGGDTAIYDTDFHSLDSDKRNRIPEDLTSVITLPVIINNNVFIGAHSIILKGVTIGENSIVGGGSVVTKSIPPHQIWAGNPAKFIRNII